jgi:hypothetical protein
VSEDQQHRNADFTRGCDGTVERWYDEVLRDGLPLLGSPRDAAQAASRASAARRSVDEDGASRELVERYVLLSGVAGFLWGLPGYLTMPVTLPANVIGLLLLHLHMSQALAILEGLDPADARVRRRCLRQTAGNSVRADADGLAQRAASKLSERGFRFFAEQAPRLAGRSGRSMPLVGGIVGGLLDARSTGDLGARLQRALRRDDTAL